MKPFFACLLSLALLLTGCDTPPTFKSTDLSAVSWGKELKLTDHTGKTRQLADFRGKAVVLFFGYTQCPDVCPTTLSAMRDAMKLLGTDAERVQVLFVTLDPARDTAELLAQYVPQFHPSFIGLRGDETAIATVAKEFKVFYTRQPGATPTAYTIDHSTGSYVFDPQGKLRLLLRHGEPVADIAADLRILLGSKATAFVATSAEQVNLDFGSPPIMVAKHTLAQRQSRLIRFYEPGIIGLGSDGMVKMRDASHLKLAQRQIAEKLIDAENPDRNSLIFAIAQAHGGDAAIPAVREAQIKRWQSQFKSGWWLQDAKGIWYQKP